MLINFHNVFTNGLRKKFATQWLTHYTYLSLHYLVKYKYPKTYNIYRWKEGLMVNFGSI